MVVKRNVFQKRSHRKKNQLGQSLVEFAFMVPLIIGVLVFLREVNMAVNSAIVNQRYARATLHFLLFNHRWYPELRFARNTGKGVYLRRWWVGVEKDKTAGGDEDVTAPVAPIIKIGRAPGDEDQGVESMKKRQNVRIRAVSFICLQPYGTKLENTFSRGQMSENTFLTPGFTYCQD